MTLSIRVMEWSVEGSCGYGFCFGDYNFFFNHGERRLILKRDKETVYCRENFFFTSDDYHIFTLNCSGKLLSLYVDTGKLDDISLPAPVYGNIVFYTDGAMVRINDVDLVKY